MVGLLRDFSGVIDTDSAFAFGYIGTSITLPMVFIIILVFWYCMVHKHNAFLDFIYICVMVAFFLDCANNVDHTGLDLVLMFLLACIGVIKLVKDYQYTN